MLILLEEGKATVTGGSCSAIYSTVTLKWKGTRGKSLQCFSDVQSLATMYNGINYFLSHVHVPQLLLPYQYINVWLHKPHFHRPLLTWRSESHARYTNLYSQLNKLPFAFTFPSNQHISDLQSTRQGTWRHYLGLDLITYLLYLINIK